MLRQSRGAYQCLCFSRGDDPQSFVFLRLISFAFGVFERLKIAFCARKHIINSIKKYISMTKLQSKHYPCCEQCFIILSSSLCVRSAQYYKYFFVYYPTIFCSIYIPYLQTNGVISQIVAAAWDSQFLVVFSSFHNFLSSLCICIEKYDFNFSYNL